MFFLDNIYCFQFTLSLVFNDFTKLYLGVTICVFILIGLHSAPWVCASFSPVLESSLIIYSNSTSFLLSLFPLLFLLLLLFSTPIKHTLFFLLQPLPYFLFFYFSMNLMNMVAILFSLLCHFTNSSLCV